MFLDFFFLSRIIPLDHSWTIQDIKPFFNRFAKRAQINLTLSNCFYAYCSCLAQLKLHRPDHSEKIFASRRRSKPFFCVLFLVNSRRKIL